jgi:hypothetical protein
LEARSKGLRVDFEAIFVGERIRKPVVTPGQ